MRVITTLALAGTMMIGSAVSADESRDVLAAEAQARIGATPAWDADGDQLFGTLLADGLTREDAVQVALLRNPELAAALEELGIARADALEAGLYSNPGIASVIQWADEGDPEIEVEATWNFADLWLVPIRERGARVLADAVTMTALAELLNAAADARMAWDAAVAARAVVEETTAVRDAARDLIARMDERNEYGFGEQLDIERTRAEVAEVEMELAMAEADLAAAQAGLRRALNLPPEAPLAPEGDLPVAGAEVPQLDALVAHALATRPETRAAELSARAAGLDLRLERRSTWQEVELGPVWTREPDGTEVWSLVLGVELPIADDNRAGRRRAEAQLRQSEHGVQAAEAMVREEVEVAAAHLAAALRNEALVRDSVIPTRQQAYQFAQTHYMQMELSMLSVIETRRELAEARLMHVKAKHEVAKALVELEFAAGGRLP